MRRRKPSGIRNDRKFIPARKMRVIRWDVAVANRQDHESGRDKTQYVSLHAWGCGCCFLIPVQRVETP